MRTVNKTRRESGIEVERTSIMKAIPLSEEDIYVKSNPSISLMQLAFSYYNDSSKWWIIARANNLTDIFVLDGSTLRIPINSRITYHKE